ncbi:hypothetical protein, partial [Treponema sp.]|uniref:hypothetical protein n=1 Tax=Treponema sp. TaxID=166 RepID=UPI00257D2362
VFPCTPPWQKTVFIVLFFSTVFYLLVSTFSVATKLPFLHNASCNSAQGKLYQGMMEKLFFRKEFIVGFA